MAHRFTAHSPFEEPIDMNWTVRELCAALAEQDSPDDALAARLTPIEAALSARFGAPDWRRAPSAVALLRSIVALGSRHPQALGLRLHQLDGAYREGVLQHSHNGRAILVASP